MAHQATMAEALRLTRSGNLAGATAMIQTALGGGASFSGAASGDIGAMNGLLPDMTSFSQAATAPRTGSDRADGKPAFERLTRKGADGTMDYWLYRPARIVAGMPLVVMLHGCTQSPEDFARGTGMNRLAEEMGFLVAYPQQTRSANAQKCWNWFRPGDQQRDAGEPALIAAITRGVMADHGIDPNRVYVAGLSAGGAAAAIMAAAYPDIYAAVGVHSGLACGAARDLSSALAAMQRGAATMGAPGSASFVPLITFHGDADTTVNEANSRQIVASATRAAGVPLSLRVETGRTASGRSFTRTLSVDPDDVVRIEQWTVQGAGHAWAGGDASGSYTDPAGPDASREMVRFFLDQARGCAAPQNSKAKRP